MPNAGGQVAQPQENPIVKRTTIRVRDMDRAIAFYEQVLGMRQYYNREVTLDRDFLPGERPGDRVHLVIMQGDDPVIGMIGLLKWLEPPQDPPPVSYEFAFGQPVFVVAVQDAAALLEKARALGCHIRSALTETVYPTADGGAKRVRSVGLFDPDGHFFECNQTLETTPGKGRP